MHPYCGFLEKRSSSSLSFQPWTLQWFVLQRNIFSSYSDETEKKLLSQQQIDETFQVQVAPPDGSRSYVFEIKDGTTQTSWIFSCPNSTIIESWIIAFLQVINGRIRDSENFYTGLSRDNLFSPIFQPLHENPEITSVYQLNSPGSLDEPTLPPPVSILIGKFMKRSLQKNSWKERWLVLNETELTLFATEEEASSFAITRSSVTAEIRTSLISATPSLNSRGNRRLYIGSKVALLPVGFENQKYCFALITFSPLATNVTLRLSCETSDQLELWLTSLKIGILNLLLDRERGRLAVTSIKRQVSWTRDGGRDGVYRRGMEKKVMKEEKKEEEEVSEVIRETERNKTEDGEEEISSSQANNPPSPLPPIAMLRRPKSTTTLTHSFMRLLRSSNSLHLAAPDFILDHFTIPLTLPPPVLQSLALVDPPLPSEYLLVSVFENQRYLPLTGWSSACLLPFTDHAMFSNVVGVKYPFTHLNRSSPPKGCKWIFQQLVIPSSSSSSSATATGGSGALVTHIDETSLGHLTETTEDSPLPPRPLSPQRVKGLTDFEVDSDYLQTDPEGWVYAANFKRFTIHLSENSSHCFRKGKDLVRRRRWIRVARVPLSITHS
jgi:hypothetical protein